MYCLLSYYILNPVLVCPALEVEKPSMMVTFVLVPLFLYILNSFRLQSVAQIRSLGDQGDSGERFGSPSTKRFSWKFRL